MARNLFGATPAEAVRPVSSRICSFRRLATVVANGSAHAFSVTSKVSFIRGRAARRRRHGPEQREHLPRHGLVLGEVRPHDHQLGAPPHRVGHRHRRIELRTRALRSWRQRRRLAGRVGRPRRTGRPRSSGRRAVRRTRRRRPCRRARCAAGVKPWRKSTTDERQEEARPHRRFLAGGARPRLALPLPPRPRAGAAARQSPVGPGPPMDVGLCHRRGHSGRRARRAPRARRARGGCHGGVGGHRIRPLARARRRRAACHHRDAQAGHGPRLAPARALLRLHADRCAHLAHHDRRGGGSGTSSARASCSSSGARSRPRSPWPGSSISTGGSRR